MTWETVIGLETHVELATKTKIFCSCTTEFGGAPNTHCCPVCMGMPGTLPVLNQKVVELAATAGLALGCAITPVSRFDRKNYFYPDLPKAYQISQLYLPIARDGAVDIGGGKTIRIHELHMEEDAGKLVHDPWLDQTLADYNLKAYDDVIATCSRIISVAPDDSARVLTAYTTLGDIYYHLGEKAKAYRSYDEALKVNPEYLTVLNNYAYFLSLDGRKLKKAYSMSRITVEKEPDNATYLDTFGWILYLQGRSEEAKPYFKHAMLYGGKESAVTMDHYAEVLFDLKEYSLAFVYWNQALAKDTEGEIPGLEEKIRQRKAEMNRDRK